MHKVTNIKQGVIHKLFPTIHNLKKFFANPVYKCTPAVQKDFSCKILQNKNLFFVPRQKIKKPESAEITGMNISF
jgi:hypothetical protein